MSPTVEALSNRHSFAWSGKHMPCTGVYRCIYCGLEAKTAHPLDYSAVPYSEACPAKTRSSLSAQVLSEEELRSDLNHALSEAKKRLPEYPWTQNTASEITWALGEALLGVIAANDYLHQLIAQMNSQIIELSEPEPEAAITDGWLMDVWDLRKEFDGDFPHYTELVGRNDLGTVVIKLVRRADRWEVVVPSWSPDLTTRRQFCELASKAGLKRRGG